MNLNIKARLNRLYSSWPLFLLLQEKGGGGGGREEEIKKLNCMLAGQTSTTMELKKIIKNPLQMNSCTFQILLCSLQSCSRKTPHFRETVFIIFKILSLAGYFWNLRNWVNKVLKYNFLLFLKQVNLIRAWGRGVVVKKPPPFLLLISFIVGNSRL